MKDWAVRGILLVAVFAAGHAASGWPWRAGTQAGAVPSAAVGVDAARMPPAAASGTSAAHGAAPHGPVDAGFAQDMSLHHEQALTMARMALEQGSPMVRAIAQGIVNQQLKEIGYLQGWLLLWDAPQTSPTDDMAWMRDAYAKTRQRDLVYEQFIESCVSGKGMPGLATDDELSQLGTLRGAPFDSRFLAMMIRHHQGAVVMARFSADHAETGVVRDFARTVAAEQRREMIQMMTMLTAVERRR